MLYVKNMPGYLFWKYLPKFLIQAARLGASSVLRGGGVAYAQGFLRALRNLPYTLRQRRRIQSRRKVTPAVIDRQLYKQRPPKIPPIALS